MIKEMASALSITNSTSHKNYTQATLAIPMIMPLPVVMDSKSKDFFESIRLIVLIDV